MNIATVERIVAAPRVHRRPDRTTYPRFMVDAVVEVPWGAYPSSMLPDLHARRGSSSTPTRGGQRDPESFASFFKERVVAPADAGGVPRRQRRRPTLLGHQEAADRADRERCTHRRAHGRARWPTSSATTPGPSTARCRSSRCAPTCSPGRRTRPELVWAASRSPSTPHPSRMPESTLSDSLWDGPLDAVELAVRLLGVGAGRRATTRSRSAARRWTATATSTTP